MSDHDFVSIGIPVGNSRITISATSVSSLMSMLGDLVTDDPVDGTAPFDDIADHINTLNAAATVKGLAYSAPAPTQSAPQSAPASQPEASGKTCAHGAMVYKTGMSRKTNKPYSGYFCPAPFVPGQKNQCDAIFDN